MKNKDVKSGVSLFGQSEEFMLENDPMEEFFALNLGDFISEHLISEDLAKKIGSNVKDKKEGLINQLKELISIYSLKNTLCVLNFDTKDVVDREFYVADGMTQGYLDSESSYESNAVGGLAAAPETDNNNDTTYMLENGDYTESSVTDIQKDYLPNERLTKIKGSAGTINYDTSSISVVATTYVTYDEDVLKKSGQLDDMTFEEFKSQNSARVKTEVDPDFYTMVSKATGFPEANISIVAYEVPFFTYSSGSGRTLADYFQILLAVLIFALLGYVVFRSTRKEQVEELEPELSVETLLRSTKESEGDMEDIGYKEKSEARMLIEKFVDEKPEAVASLLRNWLNEDWD